MLTSVRGYNLGEAGGDDRQTGGKSEQATSNRLASSTVVNVGFTTSVEGYTVAIQLSSEFLFSEGAEFEPEIA